MVIKRYLDSIVNFMHKQIKKSNFVHFHVVTRYNYVKTKTYHRYSKGDLDNISTVIMMYTCIYMYIHANY